LIVRVGGRDYPVVLPKLSDARLHTAGVVMTIHVLGQTVLDFAVSVPQIAVAILTAAVIEVVLTAIRSQRIVWPASAMLTGSGVALIMRVDGTTSADHWTLDHWYLFAIVAAASLATKYAIRFRGSHLFNPSNIGLVGAFLLLGRSRVEPLNFWWHPVGPAMVIAYAVIIGGGVVVTRRLHLFEMAVAFWLTLLAGLALLAAPGHCITSPWSLTPVCDGRFWWTIVVSPEVLIFLFFMITDPKTVPSTRLPRIAFGVSVALLATLLIAPQRTEFGAKVGLLGALAIVCAARPMLAVVRLPRVSSDALGVAVGVAAVLGVGAYALTVDALGERTREPRLTSVLAVEALPDPTSVLARKPSALPTITFDPAMVAFGEAYAAAPVYDEIASEVLYVLDVEAEILRRRQSDLLRAVDHGTRLDQLRQTIVDAGTESITTSVYTFDTMHFIPVLRGGQSAAVIGVEAVGRQRLVVYDDRGEFLSETEGAVRVVIAVRAADDGRWVIVDLR
jgi:hypothetical protein